MNFVTRVQRCLGCRRPCPVSEWRLPALAVDSFLPTIPPHLSSMGSKDLIGKPGMCCPRAPSQHAHGLSHASARFHDPFNGRHCLHALGTPRQDPHCPVLLSKGALWHMGLEEAPATNTPNRVISKGPPYAMPRHGKLSGLRGDVEQTADNTR